MGQSSHLGGFPPTSCADPGWGARVGVHSPLRAHPPLGGRQGAGAGAGLRHLQSGGAVLW